MSKQKMVILGIDPGYADTGYGAIAKDAALSYIACDTITTRGGAFSERLKLLADGLQSVIERFQPHLIAVERLFFAKNIKTAIDVAQARGVILLTAARWGVPIVEYTPLQVKQSLTSYGQATKYQVGQMVRTILNIAELPKKDDAVDALAIAICAAFRLNKGL